MPDRVVAIDTKSILDIAGIPYEIIRSPAMPEGVIVVKGISHSEFMSLIDREKDNTICLTE